MQSTLDELEELQKTLEKGLLAGYIPAEEEGENVCGLCGKDFKNHKHNFSLHMKKCEAEKKKKEVSFVCATCGKGFGNNKNNHDVHIRSQTCAKKAVESFSFQCTKCDKKYVSKKCAEKHKAICEKN